jgi:uncharacterized protein
MKYVLLYESGDDVATLAPLHFAAHRERWDEFARRGSLLAIGPFADGAGAMSVFTTRAAAEEFAAGDPFVQHGVVRGWSVREWSEALLPEAEALPPEDTV